MDIIGNEVTQRIRAAITNKLKEVGVYVDDELPDYIMVMVANKKSKEQMMSDLMLFLGSNTKSFTFWLHELLDNLQATTSVGTGKVPEAMDKGPPPIAESCPVPPEEEEEEEEEGEGKEMEPVTLTIPITVSNPTTPLPVMDDDTEEVLTFQTELETDDVLMQELEKEDQLSEAQKALDKNKANKISLKTGFVHSRSPERTTAPSKTAVKVRPIFHRKTSQTSLLLQRPTKSYDSYLSNDEDEEGEDKYDPRNPSVNSVASVVRVSQRKSSVPPALQANKLLLFKAMEDANKSVSHVQRKTQVHVEPYEPTPISKLKKKPTLRVCSQEVTREVPPVMAVQEEEEAELSPFGEDLEVGVDQHQHLLLAAEEPKEIHVPVSSTKVPLMPTKRKLTREPVVAQSEVIAARNPRFVVTLDGVDPSQFLSPKSLRSVISQRGPLKDQPPMHHVEEEEQELEEEEEEEEDMSGLQYEEQDTVIGEEEMEEDVPTKKAKLQVRCLKWPACPHGDACRFHHPKTHCKMFPNCSFGVKCLFLHPNCKYDSFCKKRDCPFTHAGKRKPGGAASLPITLKTELVPVASNVVCKFHPDCLNPSCTFFHPKNCKFGLQCKNPGCQFSHPLTSVAPPHQLKWTAPKPTTSSRKFSVETLEHMPIHIDK